MRNTPLKAFASPIKKDKYTTKGNTIVLNDGTGRIGLHADDVKTKSKKKTNNPSNRPIGRKIQGKTLDQVNINQKPRK